MENNHISVVIPYFNNEATIERTLNSIAKQTLKPTEVILVDDGSYTPFMMNWPKVLNLNLIRTKNQGQAAARNLGINRALGNLIAFLDADDEWLSNHLEKSMMAMEKSNADLVFSDANIVCQSKTWKFFSKVKIPTNYQIDLINSNFIITSSVVVKKASLTTLGGFDESRKLQEIEDYDLWLRLIEKFRVAYSDHVGLNYFLNSDKAKSASHQSHVLGGLKIVFKNKLWQVDWKLKPSVLKRILRLYTKGLT